MKKQNQIPAYYVEKVSNNGITYFQLVRGHDDAIIYSSTSLSRVANKVSHPTYKDGTPVIL